MSLDILLWAFLAAYIVHIVDETTMNGGFIRWIQASFWRTYTAHELLVQRLRGHRDRRQHPAVRRLGRSLDILALIWPVGFAVHGVTVHLFWTIRQRNLSPGLVTSVIYWIMAYFFVRYGVVAGQISSTDFSIGAVLGVVTVGAFLTFVPTVVVPRLMRARSRRAVS